MDYCAVCSLAIALLTASLFVSLRGDQTIERAGFLKLLSDKQLKRYQGIVRMRRRIYLESLGLGIVLTAAIILWLTRYGKEQLNMMHKACIAGAVTLGTSYFYYTLHPKSDYMLRHLDSERQRSAWLKVYRGFQVNYHAGFLLGLLGAMVGAAVLC